MKAILGILIIILGLACMVHQFNDSIHVKQLDSLKAEQSEPYTLFGDVKIIDRKYIGHDHPAGWTDGNDLMETIEAINAQGINLIGKIDSAHKQAFFQVKEDSIYRILLVSVDSNENLHLHPLLIHKIGE